jgi:hypothetical protein
VLQVYPLLSLSESFWQVGTSVKEEVEKSGPFGIVTIAHFFKRVGTGDRSLF